MKIERTHPARARTAKRRLKSVLALIVFLTLFAVSELSLTLTKTPDYLIPTPSSVLAEFVLELMSGRFVRHAFVTLSETLVGFFIAFILGIILAIAVNSSETVHEVIHPYITAFQAMPKVAIAPLIILWFGFGVASKIVLVALIAFFLIFVSTLNGLESLGIPVLELMHSYGASKRQILMKVKLPNALPYIFTGAEGALLYSLTAAVIGEFVGAREGLGYLIQLWSGQMKTASCFAVMALLVIIALTMQITFTWIKHKVLFWVAKS